MSVITDNDRVYLQGYVAALADILRNYTAAVMCYETINAMIGHPRDLAERGALLAELLVDTVTSRLEVRRG